VRFPPATRRIGTRTFSIGARRLPAGARRTAQHLIKATMILDSYVGPRGRPPLTTLNFTHRAAPRGRSPDASRSTRPTHRGTDDDEDPVIDTPLRGGLQVWQRIELRGGVGRVNARTCIRQPN
jgi:hypothetical protein